MAVRTAVKSPVKMSLDDAVKYMTVSIADMSKKMAEADRKLVASQAETDRKLAASKMELDDAVKYMTVSIADMSKKMAESRAERNRLMTESQVRTDMAIQGLTEEVDRLTKKVSEVMDGFSTVGHRLGHLVELLVIPGVRRAINEHGHNFTRSVANKIFTRVGLNGQKQEIAEVDVLLYNGTEVMAVEVKNTLTAGYANAHLEQLKKLRKYEKETKMAGKKIYGAVAGVYVDDDVYKFAKKHGLYVLEIQEEEKRLTVKTPGRCVVW